MPEKKNFRENAFVFFAKRDGNANLTCYNRSGEETSGDSFFWEEKTTLTCDETVASWKSVANGNNSCVVTTGKPDEGANTMFVFNLNTADANGKKTDPSPIVMELYSFKISEGETVVRDFVPCVRDADLAAGLYDLKATGTDKAFYVNAGAGEFKVSPGVVSVVTVGEHPHTTAVWTFGDGSVTNALTGASFKVWSGTENVTVVFTPDPDYKLVSGKFVHQLGTVNADVTLTDVPKVELRDIEYLDADGRVQVCASAEAVTETTVKLENGRWYVADGRVERDSLEVSGSAHLILLDGCELTVNGGLFVPELSAITIYGQCAGTGRLNANGQDGSAGIGGRYGVSNSCGSVTINGGIVIAKGNTFLVPDIWDCIVYCAGIGGCGYASGGVVKVNGGRVIAETEGRGAGIGGGYISDESSRGGDGGSVTIRGGTVTANSYTYGIGGGYEGGPAEVTILGGSVDSSIQNNVQKNGAGEPLRKVTLELPPSLDYDSVEVGFRGLDQYGFRDIVPVDNRVFFYLPDGQYEIVADIDQPGIGTRSIPYVFIVSGRDVVCSFQEYGLKVNDEDIALKLGEGWSYQDRILTITGNGQCVLSGVSLSGDVQVKVAASDCKVILSDAIVYTQGRPAFVVEENLSGVSLQMKGGVSHLATTNATDGTSFPALEVKSVLTVDFASDADALRSAVYVFNYGEASAIAGNGSVSVVGGHLCAWSDERAVAATCGFDIAQVSSDEMIAQAGASWADMQIIFARNPVAPIVEIAPSRTITIPADVSHIASIVVSNDFEEIFFVWQDYKRVYRVMQEDNVVVIYGIEDGFSVLSENPMVLKSLQEDVVIGSDKHPLPNVRKKLTLTLPSIVEGLSFAVYEDDQYVAGQQTSDKLVYDIHQGCTIQVVCRAAELWRIVSETNVVTFTNIQESRVLSAADLPQAWRLFSVNVPAVANATCSLASSDGKMLAKGSGTWQVLSNAEVTVTFYGVGNYRVTANGAKTWTLTGDVTFGTTDGFLLPTVEGIPGTVAAPWPVGENVQAYTNGAGVLTITGAGAMDDFASATDVPWDPANVTAVSVDVAKIQIGANVLAALADGTKVNKLLVSDIRPYVPGFVPPMSEQPSGAISPAEFERVDIVGGKAYLGVSVYTNSEVKVIGEGGGWGVATNGVIEVPAPGKQGFFYLMSKPAAPSDAPHAPITILE